MINIPIWLLMLLIASNVFVWVAVSLVVYLIAYIRDITYYRRHKIDTKCPYKVEHDETKD